MQKISRRSFLQMMGGAVTAAMLPNFNFSTLPMPSNLPVPIPPSLMLHSPHGKGDFLPNLLAQLQAAGFMTMTYKGWKSAVLSGQPLHDKKPILISIDDLTLSEGVNAAWETFSSMKETIQKAGMVATYGVITSPVIMDKVWATPDSARWDLMTEWIEAGFELATHTAYHSNFNNRESLPREDFSSADYEAEICDSAKVIETELASRGIRYKVETLILPYGSGYSYKQPTAEVHSGIIDACRQTHVRMIAGIPQGREPLKQWQLVTRNEQLYMGRLDPLQTAEGNYSISWTIDQLEKWSEQNQKYAVARTAFQNRLI